MLISTLVSMILLVALVWSIPDSALRRTTVPVLEPVAVTGGLDQSWFMFAPDPYRHLETVQVHATTSDGDERVWTFPRGNVLDQFSWYRWHKLKEQSVRVPEIRPGIAQWAAGQLLEPSEYPAKVSLILTTVPMTPPGYPRAKPTPATEILYTETMAGPR